MVRQKAFQAKGSSCLIEREFVDSSGSRLVVELIAQLKDLTVFSKLANSS